MQMLLVSVAAGCSCWEAVQDLHAEQKLDVKALS